jgi:NADPH:quinone reductase
MRAWRVEELGDPRHVLRWRDDLPIPEPGTDDVAIDVYACGLNFPDILLCQGKYQEKPPLPFTPGVEVSGVVRAVGANVTRVAVGDRVLASPKFGHGGLAEVTIAPATGTYKIPVTLSFAKASALHVTYQTGHCALHRRANIQPGETLLVHAGAGGVGSAAIQLGKAAGARVIATAGGQAKAQVCLDLGADVAIDYSKDDFAEAVKAATNGRGADVIYDPVGGDTFDRSRKCIAWEGRILVIGFTSGRIADAPTNHALIKNYSVVGVHWAAYNRHDNTFFDTTHAQLMDLHAQGKIDPFVSEEIATEAVPDALVRLGARGTVGKIVALLR